MTLTKIAENLVEAIKEETGYTLSVDVIERKGDNIDGGCIRFDPSPYSKKEFIDGTKQLSYRFSVWIRAKEAEKARNRAGKIMDYIASLDGESGLIIQTDEGDAEVGIENITTPQFIEEGRDFYIYMASFGLVIN